MCTSFIDAVRSCLKSGGYARVKDGEDIGGSFLVGYRGKLYRVEGDFQVGKSLTTFDACGCGEDYALGALAAGDTAISAKERIERALEIAARFSAGVAPPFFVLTSGNEKI